MIPKITQNEKKKYKRLAGKRSNLREKITSLAFNMLLPREIKESGSWEEVAGPQKRQLGSKHIIGTSDDLH